MKHLITLTLFCSALAAFAKDKPPLNLPYTADGHIQYREVIEMPGVPAAELMKRARLWLAKAYRSAPDVMKGNEEDQLVAKGLFQIHQGGMGAGVWTVRHILSIESKDGRARVTLDGFEVEWGERMRNATALDSDGYQKGPNDPRFGFRSLFEGVDREARALIASLQVALSKPAESW